ncbi:hypothetical protein Emag_005263 [Eimeria magna]
METVVFKWPAAWRLAQPLPAAEREALIGQVEAGAALLLHMRDDALKRQLEDDKDLQQWLTKLLYLLPPAHDLFSVDASPLPERTQKYHVHRPVSHNLSNSPRKHENDFGSLSLICAPVISIRAERHMTLYAFMLACRLPRRLLRCRLLLRTFLRLGRLQEPRLQQQQLLPCTACLDVCLLWEVADPVLCSKAAAALLESLKSSKKERLLEELRESLPAAIEAAATALTALGRRHDSPMLLPTGAAVEAAAAANGSVSAAWMSAAAAAVQPLLEALATLRAATCCLPTSFALQLWHRDRPPPSSVDAMVNSFLKAAPQQTPAAAPFAALLMRVYGALMRPPWAVHAGPSAYMLPPGLHRAVARARVLVCSCLVGVAAAQSEAVRKELKASLIRRPSRWLAQQAEELLQEWGASLLQLFEAASASGGTPDCTISDLKACGACRLLQQWRTLNINADLLEYIDSIITPQTHEPEGIDSKKPVLLLADSSKSDGPATWELSPEDAKTIAQLQDMLPEHGPGYLYLALRELRGNAEEVVSLLLENKTLAGLRSVPLQATLEGKYFLTHRAATAARAYCSERVAEEALEDDSDSSGSLYDDDADEELLAEAAAAPRSADESEVEESSSSEESGKEAPSRGAPSRGGHMPVRGGTLAARRKEAHKASVGNHSRRDQ